MNKESQNLTGTYDRGQVVGQESASETYKDVAGAWEPCETAQTWPKSKGLGKNTVEKGNMKGGTPTT